MPRQPIDIERLLEWAIGESGHLPWRGCSERELAFDHGYTVIPKRCAHGYQGGQVLLRRAISDDAAAVIAAVRALEPAIAAIVIACARDGTRPPCFPGVEATMIERKVYGRRRRSGKRRGRPTIIREWDIEPRVIREARSIYGRWHAALRRVAEDLQGRLNGFQINGFAAPAAPWITAPQKSA